MQSYAHGNLGTRSVYRSSPESTISGKSVTFYKAKMVDTLNSDGCLNQQPQVQNGSSVSYNIIQTLSTY